MGDESAETFRVRDLGFVSHASVGGDTLYVNFPGVRFDGEPSDESIIPVDTSVVAKSTGKDVDEVLGAFFVEATVDMAATSADRVEPTDWKLRNEAISEDAIWAWGSGNSGN